MKFFAYTFGALALAAFAAADKTEDLLKDVGKLREQAHSLVEKLKTEGKHILAQEIEIIDKEIEVVKSKVEKLEASTDSNIIKLGLKTAEDVLEVLEARLRQKIHDLSKNFDATKEELMKDAGKLRGEARTAIEKLKSEGKHLLAHEIEILDKEIESLEKKCADFHPKTEVGRIGLHAAESILHGLEARLQKKIKDLSKNFDATKEELLKDAGKLRGEAKSAIEKLKSEGKHLLAHEIEILDKEIVVLEGKIEKLEQNTNTPVMKVGLHAAETVLKSLEARLQKKIKDLSKNFDATKDELLKDAGKLRGEAKSAIEKLKSEGKHLLAHEIEILDKEIVVLEGKIEKLEQNTNTPVIKVGLNAAETVLKSLEARLQKKIKDLNAGYDSTKEELIKDAGKLRQEARTEIEKLKKEGKHTLAAELEILEKAIETVEKNIEKAHPTTEVGKIAISAAESVLRGLERKLQAQIAKLNTSAKPSL